MLAAPFPWFGGKSRVSHIVWEAFGDVKNYVEPFFGSGAVLLGRPDIQGIETINDLDGFVANFWRAIAADSDSVAMHADWPVNEADLHARHLWLVANREDLTSKIMADPAFYDARVAGWWVWGICSWIGSGWCSGNGPWKNVNGKLVKSDVDLGINKQLPHLGDAGQGIHRKLPHLGAGRGINRQLPHLGSAGQGIHRKLPHLGAGQGIREWFDRLQARLRNVRIACGDWSRVIGESVTIKHPGVTAVFLDPPYSDVMDVYATDVSSYVASDVRKWAIENGGNKRMRIALCGYDGEHSMPDGWQCVAWKSKGGYGSQSDGNGRKNSSRERIWFSPHCMRVMRHSAKSQRSLFEEVS